MSESFHTFRFLADGKHLNCLDMSQDLLAVGTTGSVLFWDRRTASDNPKQPSACLAAFNDTHEEEVTQVSTACILWLACYCLMTGLSSLQLFGSSQFFWI